MIITVICDNCGTEIEKKKADAERGSHNFCSRKCYYEWLRGENHPQYKGGKVTVICDTCGAEFKKHSSQIQKHTFCSKKCMSKWQRRNRVAVICENCGITFEKKPSNLGKHNFCGGKCSQEWHNKKIIVLCDNCGARLERVPSQAGEHNFCNNACWSAWLETSVVVECINCGISFKKIPSQLRARNFCSRECWHNWATGENFPRYKHGMCGTSAYSTAAFAKRRARIAKGGGSFTAQEWESLCAQFNNHCVCCGRDDIALTADHVVPLALGGSSYITNIQPLCISCNSRKNDKTIDYRQQWLRQAPLFEVAVNEPQEIM